MVSYKIMIDGIHIISENKCILLNKNHAHYINSVMYNFNFYFDVVEPTRHEGIDVVDFRNPKKHKIIGFDLFDVLCPSVAEGYPKQYLDFANIKSGDVILDLGAYSGFTSIVFSLKTGKTGKVICVEPDVLNIKCCIENMKEFSSIVGYNNFELFHGLVWNSNEEIPFSMEGSMGSAASSIVGTDRGNILNVPSFTLSDLAKNTNRIDFIKCDIEGAEEFIFNDDNFFNKHSPKIIIEPHKNKNRGRINTKECIESVEKYGYKCRVIDQIGINDIPLIECTRDQNG